MKIVSRFLLVLGVALALTPIAFGAGRYLEGRFFPVTAATELLHAQSVPHGISFYVRFRKLRSCEFVGLIWYQHDRRYRVEFEPDAVDIPATRPPGDQHGGPWLVRGLDRLDESRAYAFHRCHPLWITITRFYTGPKGD